MATKTTLPWVEKYRPKNVSDISHQDEVVNTLKSSIANGQLPHLLFYGPPGTGKTSTIIAVARELFGPKFRENGRFLELNASDDRGISVVREKVKAFAQGAISGSSSMPPFKIIVLDEADSMTNDAQSALRRMMENYSKVTRFCLICNYVSRIIEPVASRCAKFRYQPLEVTSMTARIQYICGQEDVTCAQDAVDTLLEVSSGDLRKAINYLQSAKQLNGAEITKDDILAIAGVAPKELFDKLWRHVESNSFDLMKNEVDDIIYSGFPVLTILHQLVDEILAHKSMSPGKKATVCLRVAEADKKLGDGASEHLQLLDVASFLMQTYHET
ncbi:hypothetical protein SPRG_11947 [Saprolegnia parasitica CBS 223.65]|uniref:AAA+ ATPase domain-containing protein n=1 Tax=Saprolegnia parasitica (strain CBS 223.65) TaxID=695850 RepID=A0A067BXV5_SAPPC|nr:hypothetical protein SPRG_11947 [Saprolegnia parasitica CBS 223.65]KDO23103.1 hypothetical protein SPRG_11947 [Saprolegnia parasitica CBS 223.65]|eukprot:XP_012206214.1 hypothetical protein SPRG_11947 [Saprolegnia parasitica CBS 223.65]